MKDPNEDIDGTHRTSNVNLYKIDGELLVKYHEETQRMLQRLQLDQH